VLLEPKDAYRPVVDRLEAGAADVVLGLFPPIDPMVNDQVRVDASGRVTEVAPKPVPSPMDCAWAIAAWRPTFTRFLRARTTEMLDSRTLTAHDGREYSVGHALSDALAAGLVIEGARLEGGAFLDIGTPRGLALALSDGRADPRP
jgi:glucose-1-phosphate thymidylyltransferase